MRSSVVRLALGQSLSRSLGWGALAVAALCSIGCGSRSTLDAGSVQSRGGSSAAQGGSKSSEPQGAQSSMSGSSDGAASGNAAGGTSGGATQSGGSAGSSDTPKDIPAATSGTRLKAQFLSTPDGVMQFTGFYDTERDETCQLQLMPDDRVWCVPTAVHSDTYYLHNGLPRYGIGPYSDADCTKQFFVDPPSACASATPPRYWVTHEEQEDPSPTSCKDPDWKIRPIGDPLELDFEGTYYRDENGQCNWSYYVPQGRFYELGEPLPHSALVSAHEQNRDMPARLVAREWVTDDGAQQALGWYDTQRREACRITLMEDASLRCAPEFQGYADHYDDAACMRPVVDVMGRGWCRGVRQYGARVIETEGCGLKLELHELGEDIPYGTEVRLDDGQCHVWRTASSEHPFARLGAAIPAQTFDPLRTVWVGSGRLREERHANPEGFTLPANSMVPLDLWSAPPRYADSEREEICFFQTTEDGLSRCVPLSFTIYDWKPNETPRPRTDISLDPSCKVMDQTFLRRHYCAPLGTRPPESHYSEVPKAIVTTAQDSCTSYPQLWSVQEVHNPRVEPIYWLGNPPGTQCLDGGQNELDFVGIVGERIPRTAFQAAVMITEQ